MISVIIPTRDRSVFIASALESLICQSISTDKFEILVIDNGSTDATRGVIDFYRSKLPNLYGLYAPEPGLHTGRHVGLKFARGDILVFADDDIVATRTWLASIEESFTDPEVAMVGGNNLPLFLTPPPSWVNKIWNRPTFARYKAIPSLSVIQFIGSSREITPHLIWGCNFAIRKNVLLDAGGFHPDGMPKELIRFRGDGETHVSRYVADSGLKCMFHPGASVHHKVTPERMTYEYFRQRGFNQGVSDSYTQLRQQDQSLLSPKREFLKGVLSYALRRVLILLDDSEVKRAFKELKCGHREGYAYHQAAYRDDPEVREWVHRPIYF